MCKQSIFFVEALPFVARRVMDLELLKHSIPIGDWTQNYGQEMEGWTWVLDSWNNNEQVAEAKEKCSQPRYALPLSLIGV